MRDGEPLNSRCYRSDERSAKNGDQDFTAIRGTLHGSIFFLGQRKCGKHLIEKLDEADSRIVANRED